MMMIAKLHFDFTFWCLHFSFERRPTWRLHLRAEKNAENKQLIEKHNKTQNVLWKMWHPSQLFQADFCENFADIWRRFLTAPIKFN